ncbi:MAG TPA: formate/nitrite transporter family protein [Ktedonobacterales bacterium]|nr:formate/nitrite transporter family protein [Ktedonobacterales bacterium]
MAQENASGAARMRDERPNREASLEDHWQTGDGGEGGRGEDAQGKRAGSAQASEALQSAFHKTLAEGEERLSRSLPSLLATGLVGGIDVGTGVLGLLLVLTLTHSEVGASLAFGIGFIALSLGNSELFTENFLVPIAPIVARRARITSLLRLWIGTLVMNLIGGWIITLIVITALPETRPTAITLGEHFVKGGVTLTSFASAVLGGVIITLMTWMERNTESVTSRIVASLSAAFLLAAGHLNHAIVASLEMFAALHAGATFGYLTWLKLLGWAVLGNVIGGVLFVTVLRLVQVGAETIQAESHRARQERPDVDL